MSEMMKDVFIGVGYAALTLLLIFIMWWLCNFAYSSYLNVKNEMLRSKMSAEIEREQIKQMHQIRMQQSLKMEQLRMQAILRLDAPASGEQNG